MTTCILAFEFGALAFLLALSFVYAVYIQIEFLVWERKFRAIQREN